jgi:hypothetical protein
LLAALNDFKLATAFKSVGLLEQVASELQTLEGQLSASDRIVIETMQRFVNALAHLCNWVQHSLSGEPQPERFLNAAKGQAAIAEEVLSTIKFPLFAGNAQQIITAIKAVNQLEDVKAVVAAIGSTPIPIIYLTEDKGRWDARSLTGEEPPQAPLQSEGPFVIKAMFDIERQPWSNQQVLLAETLHDLHAKLTIPTWPEESDYLLIDYISTLSPEQYRITTLRIDRPKKDEPLEFDCTGHVEFPVPQNLLSEPIVIRVRATFFSTSEDKQGIPATIVGYHQLRVRVSDKTRTPLLSGHKAIDARIEEIVREVRQSLTTIDMGHLGDFIAALSAIANYLGINLQQALYKQGADVSEASFQSDLLYHLRLWLGEEVQEAPRQAGGPTDIRYRSVTIELKVEDNISDRRKMIEKYCAQPVQYSSGSGAQLGILCILDQTEKHNPPANPQNQISLETPPVHGFPEGYVPYPTKIAVIIIDGKLRWPSSYSR